MNLVVITILIGDSVLVILKILENVSGLIWILSVIILTHGDTKK